jgi:hypothetical protein
MIDMIFSAKNPSVLNVSQSLISLDISFLRQRAREAISVYLENKLPLIFNQSRQVFLT